MFNYFKKKRKTENKEEKPTPKYVFSSVWPSKKVMEEALKAIRKHNWKRRGSKMESLKK